MRKINHPYFKLKSINERVKNFDLNFHKITRTNGLLLRKSIKILHIYWSQSRSRSGATFEIFPGAGTGVEPGSKIDRLRNLGIKCLRSN